MISVADATARILELVGRVDAEVVELDDADGRVLAEPAVAGRALPGFDNSAMDGFAVRAAELPATLPVVGSIAAGAGVVAPLAPGTAVRIMTGAPLPAGADAVVIFEDARAEGGLVTLPATRAGDNLRRAGEDLAIGELAVPAGTRLGPGELTALAALGCATVAVARRPRVALLATGDELVGIHTVPGPGQLVDSSAYGLRAAIAAAGGVAHYLGAVGDDRAALATAIARALAADVVITTGGVSAGDHDHVRGALAEAGVTLDFWKVAMKPGKPLAVGRSGSTGATRRSEGAGGAEAPARGATVFALPGNPVSSAVAFELFVRPALLAMQGALVTARPRAPVIVPSGYRKPPGRAHYLRARLTRRGGDLVAIPHPKQGSAMISSLVGCDALIEIAAEAEGLEPGDHATALLLRAV